MRERLATVELCPQLSRRALLARAATVPLGFLPHALAPNMAPRGPLEALREQWAVAITHLEALIGAGAPEPDLIALDHRIDEFTEAILSAPVSGIGDIATKLEVVLYAAGAQCDTSLVRAILNSLQPAGARQCLVR
jgi:hypothetical protein